jgi:hypothetical protein
MLLVSGTVAFFGLRSQFRGDVAPPLPEPAALDALDPSLEDAGPDATDEGPGRDLLAAFGSWDGVGTVRLAFAAVAEAAVAAAPAGETGALAPQQWVGADPPRLHVGVLLVGDAARRAVLDGHVVGVGDRLGEALVVAIERDRVVLTWSGRRLTYDLASDHPREFHGELRRRGVDPMAAPGAADATKMQEELK